MKKVRLYIRLTEKEKETLKGLSERSGKSISEIVRIRTLSKKKGLMEKEDRQELKALLKEARQINRTLNLYHEERQENTPFLARVRKFAKKYT